MYVLCTQGPNKCKAFNTETGFCEHHRSTILEISTGQIDRGASLSWVSQFAVCRLFVFLRERVCENVLNWYKRTTY